MVLIRAVVVASLMAFLGVVSTGSNHADAGGLQYVVDLTSDGSVSMCQAGPGDCSLRGAITLANVANTPGDTITFDPTVFPPAAPATIALNSQLPVLIGGNDTIDGTGAGVVIDTNLGPLSCLGVNSDNNTIKGLRIKDCGIAINVLGSGNMIGPGNNLYGNDATNDVAIRLAGNNNTARGNFIGTTADGSALHPDGGNFFGVVIEGGAMNNVIGGPAAADRNIISGNGTGIRVSGTGTTIKGNYIGTDASGTLDLGNQGIGIMDNGASIIGGSGAGEGNIVSGNTGVGIQLAQFSGTTGAVLQGNLIGTAIDGVSPLGNDSHGVHIALAPVGNTIGGTAHGQGNVIAFNAGDGVFLASGIGVTMRGNSMHSSTGLGIDLSPDGVNANDGPGDPDTGPNLSQNFPEITSAARVSRQQPDMTWVMTMNVQGTPVSSFSANFALDFYGSQSCDASGKGEGADYLGSTMVMTSGSPTGSAAFDVDFPAASVSGFVTATATSSTGDTSEFSACSHVDSDGDGDFDEADNCPNWPNPAQTLPTWTVPAGDSDCDGFADSRETYVTTDPAQQCAATSATSDEGPPDFWPLDMNDSQQINTVDVGAFVGKLGLDNTEIGWTARLDLSQSPNGIINTVDVGFYVGRLGKVCSPTGP
jgi:hypothetical protein